MSIWHTLGKHGDPVDGQPWEFQNLENRFRSIKTAMQGVDRAFDAIRQGSSEDFQGEAAKAFGTKLNEIATAVGEVPLIAGQIEATFRNHRTQLEALRSATQSAVARAQTNWNEKGAADADHDEAKKNLSWVEKQIRWVDTHPDQESERPYWTSKKIDAQHWVNGSRGRVNRANDAVEDSKREWNRLRDREDELDRSTANALKNTALWSLADPSTLQQIKDAIGDFFSGIGEFADYIFSGELLVDLCEVLYELIDAVTVILSLISLVLTVIGAIVLVFSWFTGVGAVVAAGLIGAGQIISNVAIALGFVNVGLGAMLAMNGRRSWQEVGGKLAIAILAVVVPKAFLKGVRAGVSKDIRSGATLAERYHRYVVTEPIARHAPIGESIVSGLIGGHADAQDRYFDYSPEFRQNQVRRDQFTLKILSNFDFDPPPRNLFRLNPPPTLRLAPTGW